ncbi:hypothetical protein ACM46_03590 [Chryseobacterium angstadtii]|uniref:Uncharacterized protein n=1 Tax=Chryseobacterium angstadtii TaxID=558151 RepID=A0A0J7LCH8_9FLAO|nr:hypothetical protein ACM46_03590 [Chryseobacterium angstadtii]
MCLFTDLLTDVSNFPTNPVLVIFLWKNFGLSGENILKVVVKIFNSIFHYEINSSLKIESSKKFSTVIHRPFHNLLPIN